MTDLPNKLGVRFEPLLIPAYAAGDDGSIWSKRRWGRWKEMKLGVGNHGYRYVNLYPPRGKASKRCVHRCVLEAFVGPCPEGMECRHLDGNKLNNRLGNICWGTKLENAADKIVHGTLNCGEINGSAVIDRKQAAKIRALRGKATCVEIGRKFGISRSQVCAIQLGRYWRGDRVVGRIT